MPYPKSGEERSAFIARCMKSAHMRKDRPDPEERLGKCFGLWRQKKSK